MAHIVSPASFLAALGESEMSPEVMNALDTAEALFESATGRSLTPFSAAQTDRTEVHDGNGEAVLYLDYPIAALTSVKLGYDPMNPAETLVVNDQSVLNWRVGETRLQRIGGRFGCQGQPNYVQVVYDTQADVPDMVVQAVIYAGKALYSGELDGVSAESLGAYSVDYKSSVLKSLLETSDVWVTAVNANKRWVVA